MGYMYILEDGELILKVLNTGSSCFNGLLPLLCTELDVWSGLYMQNAMHRDTRSFMHDAESPLLYSSLEKLITTSPRYKIDTTLNGVLFFEQ